jgi:hypothetical protein
VLNNAGPRTHIILEAFLNAKMYLHLFQIFLAIDLDRFSFTNTGGGVLVKQVKADPQKDLK